MSILRKIKPNFWDEDLKAGPIKSHFHFRRIWKMAVLLTAGLTLIPLVTMAFIDYRLTEKSIESETFVNLRRLVSNTRRTVSSYLGEMENALNTIDSGHTLGELTFSANLYSVLTRLKGEFRGFVNLGVFDLSGKLLIRAGPGTFPMDVAETDWFRTVKSDEGYAINTFIDGNGSVRMGVSMTRKLADGHRYVLRATLDGDRFQKLLSSLELSPGGDAFIIDRSGVLQTPSRYHGDILDMANLRLSDFSHEMEVTEVIDKAGNSKIIGYGRIPESPLILIIVNPKTEIMRSWYDAHMKMIWFLIASILFVLVVILGVATYLVDLIYKADRERAMMQREADHTNRMASIGRLAAGVAHEINNPLAIINEKAGLLKDLFTFMDKYKGDERLLKQLDHIISSVERCSFITQRLLRFARHIDDFRVQTVHLKNVVLDTIEFLHKEAEYRCIDVNVDLEDGMTIETDRGKLQQIILNLVNNAFAAMSDGGHLDIIARRDGGNVLIEVADNGSGISETDLKRIFEPFFSTKKAKGGTGLGLSITYGLVQELGGELKVGSKLGEGTTFNISLPIKGHGPKELP